MTYTEAEGDERNPFAGTEDLAEQATRRSVGQWVPEPAFRRARNPMNLLGWNLKEDIRDVEAREEDVIIVARESKIPFETSQSCITNVCALCNGASV